MKIQFDGGGFVVGIWNNLLSNGGKFSKEHPEYRRVYLLNFILLMTFLVCLFFSFVDEFVFEMHVIAIVNFVGSLMAIGIFFHFRRKCNIDKAAFFAVILLFVILAAFVMKIQYEYYALSWVAIIPPVAYFLLGRKHARIIVGIYFALFLTYLAIGSLLFWGGDFPPEAILNIAFSVFGLTLLVSYYETSRKEASDDLEQKNRELEVLSERDCLTGLYNRNKLNSVMSREIALAGRNGIGFSVLLADMDYFKDVNDKYGHIAGDAVLSGISKILEKTCRESDYVGRWGGEEFLIICPDTESEGARVLAERIIGTTSGFRLGKISNTTLSIGITAYKEGDTGELIITRADEALYLAKENGRNRCEVVREKASERQEALL